MAPGEERGLAIRYSNEARLELPTIHDARPVVMLPPHLGGDVRNIGRCLEEPKPDRAALVATLVAVVTTFSTTIALATHGVSVGWIILPIVIASGSATAAILRFWAGVNAKKNTHLIQAKADVAILITWQDEARVRVDRELQAQFLDAQRALAASRDAKALMPPTGSHPGATLLSPNKP